MIIVCASCVKNEIKSSRINSTNQILIDSLNELAWEYSNTNLDSLYFYGVKGLNQSNDINYLLGKCNALQRIGYYHYALGNIDSALYYYYEALDNRITYGDSSMISATLNNIGATYEKKGEYEFAIKYYLEAQENITNNDQLSMAQNFDNISIIYYSYGHYSEGLEYNTKALEIINELYPNSTAHANSLLNRGNIYDEMQDFGRSLESYQNAYFIFNSLNATIDVGKAQNNIGNIYLKQGKARLAIEQYLSALDKYRSQGFKSEIAGVKINLGLAYQGLGKFDLANSYYDDCLTYWEEISNLPKQAETLIAKGDLFLQQNEYSKAKSLFLKAESIISKEPNLRSKLYRGLKNTNVDLGNINEAFHYQSRLNNLTDSLNNEFLKLSNTDSRLSREISKNEVLEKEQDLILEVAKRSNIIKKALIIGLILSTISVILLYLNWRGRRKRFVLEKKAIEKQREVELLLKDQELTSIRSVLEVQEKERKRIAQDLHDRLGSLLSMIKLHFQKTNENIEQLKSDNLKDYRKANKLLDEACDEVRKIAFNLNSGLLKNFGLTVAMEDLASTLRKSGEFDVELIVHNFEERLSSDYEITIYRIIQELVANILRHADATEISFQILKKDEMLQLTIEDNGRGYKVNHDKKGGMGLKNIKSRLIPLNGTMNVDSHIGRGTSVFIEIPLYD